MSVAPQALPPQYPRRRFTADEIGRMVDAGVMGEDERVELIDGELIETATQGVGHDMAKARLARLLYGATGEELFVGVETTIRLSDRVLVDPDLVVVPQVGLRLDQGTFITVRGTDIPLVIEIAVSSLDYDLGIKAALFARHGVREYWVVAPVLGKAWLHSGPEGDGWKQRPARGGTDVLTPIAPELARFQVLLSQLT